MRDWNVDPIILCRKHLLGSHVESHMVIGCIKRGHSLDGYTDKGLIDVSRLSQWHDGVAREIESRGWNHKSPYDDLIARKARLPYPVGYIDYRKSIKELAERCPDCKFRIDRIIKCDLYSQGRA